MHYRAGTYQAPEAPPLSGGRAYYLQSSRAETFYTSSDRLRYIENHPINTAIVYNSDSKSATSYKRETITLPYDGSNPYELAENLPKGF